MILGRDVLVWHDACHTGIRSGDAQSSTKGRSGNWGWEVYQGELSKVKAIIDKLAESRYSIGMTLFAPEHERNQKYVSRTERRIWQTFINGWPERMRSPDQVGRARDLMPIAIDSVRFNYCREVGDTSLYTKREISAKINCSSVGTYERDWQPVFAAMCGSIADIAEEALHPVRLKIADINDKYRDDDNKAA